MSERTDTERLEWLVEEGFVPALQRYMHGRWTFDNYENREFTGMTWRDAVDDAIDFHKPQRERKATP